MLCIKEAFMALKSKNVCHKCGHKWDAYGWKGYYSERCPKCGSHTPGFMFINFLIVVGIICLFALVPSSKDDDSKTKSSSDTSTEQVAKKGDGMPYYVDKDYTVIKPFPVCMSRSIYKEFIGSDKRNREYLVKNGQCIFVDTGYKISVIDRSDFSTRGIRIFVPDGDTSIVVYTGVEFVVQDPESK